MIKSVLTLQTSFSLFFLFKHFPQIESKIFFRNSWELNGDVNNFPEEHVTRVSGEGKGRKVGGLIACEPPTGKSFRFVRSCVRVCARRARWWFSRHAFVLLLLLLLLRALHPGGGCLGMPLLCSCSFSSSGLCVPAKSDACFLSF